METLYIVIAVVVGVVIVVFMLRDRITRFFARYGEGELGMDAAPPSRRKGGRSPSTRVSGNRMIGKRQRMRVTQQDADIERNLMKGEDQDLTVEEQNEPPAN